MPQFLNLIIVSYHAIMEQTLKLTTVSYQAIMAHSLKLNTVIFPAIIPYPTAFPYGNGMVLHFYQQQESSTTKTVHKVINKGLKAYV